MKKNIYVTILATIIAVTSGVFTNFIVSDNQIATATPTQYDELNNTPVGWGIKKVKENEPEVPTSYQELLSKYDSFYMNKNGEKKLYLTFDEGYENGYTSQILDTLKEKNVPAAFFITGPYAKEQKELIERMINEGHIVGNHTINHPNLPKLGTYEKISEELLGMNELVKELYSYDMKHLMLLAIYLLSYYYLDDILLSSKVLYPFLFLGKEDKQNCCNLYHINVHQEYPYSLMLWDLLE